MNTMLPDAKRKMLLLTAMSACVAMIFLDESGVGVTLPMIQKDLGLSNLGVQWVMNAFLLVLAMLVLAGGRWADYVGHRKVFMIGITIFTVASLLCGVAQNEWWLISARALQGIGASFLVPTNMTLINMGFPPHERGKALGTVIGISSFFMAGGPFIGGLLTQFLSWRWLFLLNIPAALLSIYFTLLAIPNDEARYPSCRFDRPGLLIFCVALSTLIVGLMEGSNLGWSSFPVIILLLIAVVSLLLFGIVELKTQYPLIELHHFRNKVFLAGNIILFCGQLSVVSMVFWAIWLQQSIGFSPFMAGIALLPTTGPIIFLARLGGKWLDRFGPRLPIILGTGLIMIGTFWIALFAQKNNYTWVVMGLLLCGIGTPLIMPTSVTTILSTVPSDEHGMAAGILNTMRQIGAAFGLAVVGAVIAYYEIATSYSRAFSYGIALSGLFALLAFVFALFCLPKRLQYQN